MLIHAIKLNNFLSFGVSAQAIPLRSLNVSNDTNSIEGVAKQQIYQSLASATKSCKTKTPYGKGEHSFKLLAQINPSNVVAASGWAKHFVDELKKKMGISVTVQHQ